MAGSTAGRSWRRRRGEARRAAGIIGLRVVDQTWRRGMRGACGSAISRPTDPTHHPRRWTTAVLFSLLRAALCGSAPLCPFRLSSLRSACPACAARPDRLPALHPPPSRPQTALQCLPIPGLRPTNTRAWRRFWVCTSASTFRCFCVAAWLSARACWAWHAARTRCGAAPATVCAVWRWNCGSPCCGSVVRVLSLLDQPPPRRPLVISLLSPPSRLPSFAPRLSDSACSAACRQCFRSCSLTISWRDGAYRPVQRASRAADCR